MESQLKNKLEPVIHTTTKWEIIIEDSPFIKETSTSSFENAVNFARAYKKMGWDVKNGIS